MRDEPWTFAWKGYVTRLVEPGSPSFIEDEAVLRRILRETPLAGVIRMAFTREPHFFAPSAAPSACYPFLVNHAASGDVAAVCALTVMPVYRRGTPARAAYLNLLRLLPAFRGKPGVLRAGYAAMRAFKDIVCPEGPCFTSIVADNAIARRLLEAGVRGMPAYTPLRRMETIALSARCGRRTDMLTPATVADIPELTAFYAARHGARDLAPRLGEDWFRSLGTASRPDLCLEKFLLYKRAGNIAGSVAVWDQRATRQAVVMGYAPLLSLARPVYNVWARCSGRPAFPPAGRTVNALYLAFAAFTPEAADAIPGCTLDALWRVKEHGGETALLGDPEAMGLPAARFRGVRYESMLYAVRWPDETENGPPLEGPYPETALL